MSTWIVIGVVWLLAALPLGILVGGHLRRRRREDATWRDPP